MGLLKITGEIALKQFWPDNGSGSASDGDTAKVTVDANAFSYQDEPGQPFQITHALDEAEAISSIGEKNKVIKSGGIKVRFQGIDAPELHYKLFNYDTFNFTPAQKHAFAIYNKPEYRQPFGETATVKLTELLAQNGTPVVPCTVTTAVNKPHEVVDVYGRLIGDLHVVIQGNEINLNRWMVEEGWAYPTFYASMSEQEIEALLAAAEKGKQQPNRLWQKNLQTYIGALNDKLIFRGKDIVFDPLTDLGKVLMPKLFRRLVEWTLLRDSGVLTNSFHNFLIGKKDECFMTKDFLAEGPSAAPLHYLSDFVTPFGKIKSEPQELVFREKSSALIGPNNQPVTSW